MQKFEFVYTTKKGTKDKTEIQAATHAVALQTLKKNKNFSRVEQCRIIK